MTERPKRIRPRVISVPAGERGTRTFKHGGHVPAGDRTVEATFLGPKATEAMRKAQAKRRQSKKKQEP